MCHAYVKILDHVDFNFKLLGLTLKMCSTLNLPFQIANYLWLDMILFVLCWFFFKPSMNKTFKSLIIQSEVKFYVKLPTKMMHMTARL